jgi:phosphoribosylglycinamide formyltransferase-1
LRLRKQRIAIFASGAGTNAAALVKHFANSSLAEIAWVGCNRSADQAGIYERLSKLGVEVCSFERRAFLEGEVQHSLEALKVDWVVLAGFLWRIPKEMIAAFPNRMINVHPALLPDFGGQGMYGHHVHRAVSASGRKETGITVHHVTADYDEGPPIFQVRCSIKAGEAPDFIAQKVQELEHRYLPSVVEQLIENSSHAASS